MASPPAAARRAKIVFALIDSGMGHTSPALAVKEHLERAAPGRFEFVLVDLLHALGLRTLDRAVKRSWSGVMLRFPRLIDLVHGVGHAFAGILVPLIAWIATPQFHRLERHLRRLGPDLLVTTHFITTNAIAILRRRGLLDAPVVGMVVDPYDTLRVAAHPGLDGLVTFSRRSWAAYRRRLPAVEVVRFPFPLSVRFAGRPASRDEARRALGIPADRFVLLMTAGAEGVGNFERFFLRLVRASLDVHLVVVCGRNAALRRRLEVRARRHSPAADSPTTCTVLGFVGDMERLLAACDVFLGAGGANLTHEALATGRPLILTLSAANIRGTVEAVVRSGFGWHCTSARGIVPLVRRLLAEPELLREAERRIAAAGIRSGTPELSAYLLEWIGGRPRRRGDGATALPRPGARERPTPRAGRAPAASRGGPDLRTPRRRGARKP